MTVVLRKQLGLNRRRGFSQWVKNRHSEKSRSRSIQCVFPIQIIDGLFLTERLLYLCFPSCNISPNDREKSVSTWDYNWPFDQTAFSDSKCRAPDCWQTLIFRPQFWYSHKLAHPFPGIVDTYESFLDLSSLFLISGLIIYIYKRNIPKFVIFYFWVESYI